MLSICRGDFGRSFYFDQPVLGIVRDRLHVTFALGLCAMILTITVAVPLGVAAGAYRNTWIDRLALVVAVVGQAMPTFWFALMLIVVFGVMVPILPTSGTETLSGFVMPTIVLGYASAPAIMRLTRSGKIGRAHV